jgi:hypothetical protein
MHYDARRYFTEDEYDDVKGFTLLKARDGDYHIAEKWLASTDEAGESEKTASQISDDRWLDYWVPESDLVDRVEDGLCEPKATLTDEQFEQVCKKVGWYTEQFESEEPEVDAEIPA